MDDQLRVRMIAGGIDVKQPVRVLEYGLPAQVRLAGFADEAMAWLDANRTPRVQLTKLLSRLSRMKTRDQTPWLVRISPLARWMATEELLLNRYERAQIRLARWVPKLGSARRWLLREIDNLEELVQTHRTRVREVELLIDAGEQALEELTSRTLPGISDQEDGDPDQLAKEKRALERGVQLLAERLAELRTARAIALRAIAPVHLIQRELELLLTQVQVALFVTVPAWRSWFVAAIARLRHAEARHFRRVLRSATDAFMSKQAAELAAEADAAPAESDAVDASEPADEPEEAPPARTRRRGLRELLHLRSSSWWS